MYTLTNPAVAPAAKEDHGFTRAVLPVDVVLAVVFVGGDGLDADSVAWADGGGVWVG